MRTLGALDARSPLSSGASPANPWPWSVRRHIRAVGCPELLHEVACFRMITPPDVGVVDGYAAGATFSAGSACGLLRGWGLEESARFATAAASLKCGVVGSCALPAFALVVASSLPCGRTACLWSGLFEVESPVQHSTDDLRS